MGTSVSPCAAASSGDLKKMRQLIDNGIDPNCGRALHPLTSELNLTTFVTHRSR